MNQAVSILYWRVRHVDPDWNGRIMFIAYNSHGGQIPELQANNKNKMRARKWPAFVARMKRQGRIAKDAKIEMVDNDHH